MNLGKLLACALVLIASAASATAHAAAEYIWIEDFESGRMDFGGMYRPSGNAPEITTDVARIGQYAMKSYLNRLQSDVSYRTELTFNKDNQRFEETWFGFSIFLPESFVVSEIWELVAQWHDIPNDWDNGRQNPPLLLSTHRGEWRLTNIWDLDPVPADGSFSIDGKKDWILGPTETGRWTDWVFRIRWAYDDQGYMQVWKDGELVIDTQGPNAYNDNVAPYMKLGLYKGWRDRRNPQDTVGERVLYHDEIRIAGPGARYEDVAPESFAIPPEPPMLGER